MSESEIFVCRRCGKEHEALTQEIASYLCLNLSKPKDILKVLDQVRIKCLTENITLSESQEHKTFEEINGVTNGTENETD